jgi:hypothetical protein
MSRANASKIQSGHQCLEQTPLVGIVSTQKDHSTKSCSSHGPNKLLFFSLESQDLPRQPPLELCLGQTLECLKLMAKSGLGACAFTSLDGVLHG